MLGKKGRQGGAADFLFALQQNADVDREAPFDGEKREQGFQRDGKRSLVVGNAAAVEPVVANVRFERGAVPPVLGVRWLHVIVTVDKKGRCIARF